VGEALRRIEGVITRHGQFVVTKDSGVILAR
jgi:hypothetical protein